MTDPVTAPAPGFARNALTMVLGNLLAQGLVLAVMPLLTRLYAPEAIGLQALFVSLSATLVVLATLRLDLAAVLPPDEDAATRLVGLILYQALGLAILTLAVVGLAGEQISALVAGEGSPVVWLYLLAPMAVAGALVQGSIGIATRRGAFKDIVGANVLMSIAFAVVAVGLGVAHPFDTAIVWARLVGGLACLAALGLAGHLALRWLRVQRFDAVRRQWSTYRQFLIYNTPYSLVGGLARDFPIYVFASAGAVRTVAFYALARSVTLAPTALLSSSISRVFFREAAVHWGTPRLAWLALGMTRLGLSASLPAFAVLVVWGDEIFSLVFGGAWVTAGRFAQLLAIPLWLALQTGWPERVFEVGGRQKVSFWIQMSFDALHIAVVAIAYAITGDALTAVGCYAISYTLYQLVYLFAVYRVAAFDVAALIRILAVNFVAMGASAGLLFGLRETLPLGELAGLAIAGLLAALATAITLSRMRMWRPLDAGSDVEQEPSEGRKGDSAGS